MRFAISLVVGMLCVASPALAQELVVDYAEAGMIDSPDPRQWESAAERIGGDVSVLGEITGAFSAAGSQETAYLASSGLPDSLDPFPDVAQRVVVYEGEEPVADWTLPEDHVFSRPVTAMDSDGDGIDEAVLEMSHYNMGTQTMSLALVRLGDRPEIIQTLPEVFVDSCDAGVGEQAITAARVTLENGVLVSTPVTLEC